MNTVAKRLLIIRQQSKKSQREIAKVLGITRQGYARYETGEREIGLDSMQKLCDYYKVSPNYFFMSTDYIEPSDKLSSAQLGTLFQIRCKELDDLITPVLAYERRIQMYDNPSSNFDMSDEKLDEYIKTAENLLKELIKIKGFLDTSVDNDLSFFQDYVNKLEDKEAQAKVVNAYTNNKAGK
ncbi:MAG: helix-turn-helix transcriptional regulator [Bacilli bacterium]